MSPLSPIYKSLIRYITNLIEEANSTTPHELHYWSWEARAEIDKLDKANLMGLEGFNFDENAGLWITRFGVGLSTYEDVNLLNEIEILDLLYEKFHYGVRVPILDTRTGEEIDVMKIVAFEVSPMQQTQTRNFRTISCEMLRTSNDARTD